MLIYFFLMIHFIICIVFIVIKKRAGYKDQFPFIFVILLPIFGISMWLLERFILLKNKANSKSLELEKLKVTDAIYRRVDIDQSYNQENLVPLEEALVINDTGLRRSLMLDILHKNADEYLDMLKKASLSSDVEVTHYATTTLLEIQSQFEFNIQKSLNEYHKNPEDLTIMNLYKEDLLKYINSGLIDGSVLMMQRVNLLKVLKVIIEMEPKKEDIFQYIEQLLEVKDYDEAEEALIKYEPICKEEERWYQLYVRYEWELGNKDNIIKILNQMIDKKIYMTKEGKKWFAFWSKGNSYEN